MLLRKHITLFRSQTSKSKHANLVCDVVPLARAAEGFEVFAEESAHLDDAVGHTLDFAEPLLVQGGIFEDGGCDASAVDGRVGVQGAHENLELRVNALLLGGVFADNGESTNTLAVETLG